MVKETQKTKLSFSFFEFFAFASIASVLAILSYFNFIAITLASYICAISYAVLLSDLFSHQILQKAKDKFDESLDSSFFRRSRLSFSICACITISLTYIFELLNTHTDLVNGSIDNLIIPVVLSVVISAIAQFARKGQRICLYKLMSFSVAISTVCSMFICLAQFRLFQNNAHHNLFLLQCLIMLFLGAVVFIIDIIKVMFHINHLLIKNLIKFVSIVLIALIVFIIPRILTFFTDVLLTNTDLIFASFVLFVTTVVTFGYFGIKQSVTSSLIRLLTYVCLSSTLYFLYLTLINYS